MTKKNKRLLLTFLLLLVFALPAPAMAQGIVYGDSIPGGSVVDYDVILIGQNVSVEGTVNGNVFVIGNQVRVNGEVNGSLVTIGQNVILGGAVTGGVYALGLTIELNTGSKLERDLYALSVGVASQKDSSIRRDLFAIALDAGLNGSVGRDLHTAIGPIQLYNGLMRLLGFEELTVKLHFELPKPAPAIEPTSSATPIGRALLAQRTRMRIQTPIEKTFDWKAWGIGVSREWIVLSLISMLAFWKAQQLLEDSSETFRPHPWRTTGIGLLALVIGLNLFVLGGLLGVLAFSIGLGLNYIGLWQISIAFWITTYSLLGLALTGVWFFIVYGAKIIFVYALTTWKSSFFNHGAWIKPTAILLGLGIYVLFRSIPYIGWVFDVLATAAGAGSAWLAWRSSRQSVLEPEKPIKALKKTRSKQVVEE